jgi:hypothetical protein
LPRITLWIDYREDASKKRPCIRPFRELGDAANHALERTAIAVISAKSIVYLLRTVDADRYSNIIADQHVHDSVGDQETVGLDVDAARVRQGIAQPSTKLLKPRRPEQKRLPAMEHRTERCSLKPELRAQAVGYAL